MNYPIIKRRKQNLPLPIAKCREKLMQALKCSLKKGRGWRTEIQVINEFNLNEATLTALGEKPVILNNQNVNIDIRLQTVVYEVIEELGQLEFENSGNDKENIEISYEGIVAAYKENPNYKEFLKFVEKQFIKEAIKKNHFNIAAAAREMGINRTTLVERCKKLDIKKNNINTTKTKEVKL